MKFLIFFTFASAFLYGCAGTQHNLRNLESGGDIRVDIADNSSYDYKVFIKNTVTVGWDGGNEQDRLDAVSLMFKDSCKNTQVIDQIPVPTGEYLTRKAVTWVMKVKCIK